MISTRRGFLAALLAVPAVRALAARPPVAVIDGYLAILHGNETVLTLGDGTWAIQNEATGRWWSQRTQSGR